MEIFELRLKQLSENIQKEMELLKEYENALMVEDDPRKIEKFKHAIDRIRASLASYQQEYDDLKRNSAGISQDSISKVDGQLKQLGKQLKKIKILFLASNPKDTDELELGREIREITEKIKASKYRDSIELVSAWAVRPDDLLQLLLEHQPQIVHFSGHGSSSEEIILTDKNDASKPVSNAALKALFTALKDNIKIVVLNACFSRPQAQAITDVIDCTIGMDKSIGDDAAIVFAASFYRAIGFGRSVQNAFDQGKVALQVEDIPEEKTPQLLVKKGIDPSQTILIEALPSL